MAAAEKVQDPVSSKVLLTNVDRLSAMAALHERLYRQESVQRIDMRQYLESIVSHLQSLTTHVITLECTPTSLDMHHAMQIGLITNEAVTNALQHAFGEDTQGNIHIFFGHENSRCRLRVADNGKGITGGIEARIPRNPAHTRFRQCPAPRRPVHRNRPLRHPDPHLLVRGAPCFLKP